MRWTSILLLGAFCAHAQVDPAERQKRMREYQLRNPPRKSTGLIPIPDLGSRLHNGEPGGLYPGGSNTMPESHRQAGLAAAARIQPLDAGGRPSPSGKIVMVSIGMSNTTQESQAFAKLLGETSGLNPAFQFVDCAQGGQTALITANPESNYWAVAEKRLAAAGVTPAQVQVAWLKQANAGPREPFPVEVKKLESHLAATLRNLKTKYPQMRIVFLSSRIYAGYAASPLNPEPHAYETGFAVKWIVAAQIAGKLDADLPWIAWGPYLWADGLEGRKQDSLTYSREDLAEDGTHPGPSARVKVARLLLDFLRQEPAAKSWFLAR